MHRAFLSCLLLALVAPPARGQGLEVTVEPSRLPEGRPARVRVTLANASDKAIGLVAIEARLGPLARALEPEREERGTRLDGLVITAAVESTEGDLGPAARAPRPPIVRALGEERFRAVRLLAPDAKATFELDVCPLGGRDARLTLDVQRAADALLVAVAPPERTALKTGLPPRGPSIAALARVWRAPEGNATGDALVPLDAPVARETVATALEIEPAPFPGAKALERAGLAADAVGDAVWLDAAAVWCLDAPAGATIVGREGEPARFPRASLGKTARALVQHGTTEVLVFDLAKADAFAAAVTAAKLGDVARGKATSVRVTPATLVRVLELAREHGLVLRDRVLEPVREEDPAPLPDAGQGAVVECIECRVLNPGRKDCPVCGGKGEVRRAARALDAEAAHAAGAHARLGLDAAIEAARAAPREKTKAAWAQAAALARRVLGELLLYRRPYAAGIAGRPLSALADEAVAGAIGEAARARLRLDVLEADGQAR